MENNTNGWSYLQKLVEKLIISNMIVKSKRPRKGLLRQTGYILVKKLHSAPTLKTA